MYIYQIGTYGPEHTASWYCHDTMAPAEFNTLVAVIFDKLMPEVITRKIEDGKRAYDRQLNELSEIRKYSPEYTKEHAMDYCNRNYNEITYSDIGYQMELELASNHGFKLLVADGNWFHDEYDTIVQLDVDYSKVEG